MHSSDEFLGLGAARTHELEKPHSTKSQRVEAVTAGAVWDQGLCLMSWLPTVPADMQSQALPGPHPARKEAEALGPGT